MKEEKRRPRFSVYKLLIREGKYIYKESFKLEERKITRIDNN